MSICFKQSIIQAIINFAFHVNLIVVKLNYLKYESTLCEDDCKKMKLV